MAPLRRAQCPPDRDGRDKPGHDKNYFPARLFPFFTGSNVIFSRCPVAAANRASVRVDGFARPLSSRAIALCVVFMRLASCAWLKPARARALALDDRFAKVEG